MTEAKWSGITSKQGDNNQFISLHKSILSSLMSDQVIVTAVESFRPFNGNLCCVNTCAAFAPAMSELYTEPVTDGGFPCVQLASIQ